MTLITTVVITKLFTAVLSERINCFLSRNGIGIVQLTIFWLYTLLSVFIIGKGKGYTVDLLIIRRRLTP